MIACPSLELVHTNIMCFVFVSYCLFNQQENFGLRQKPQIKIREICVPGKDKRIEVT